MSKIDIVMVTWQRPQITKTAIEAIRRNTKQKNYKLIVVDNGSDDETTQMLWQQEKKGNIHFLIRNQENKGLEPARNQGLAMVTSKYFVCADNDCIPEPPQEGLDWLERLEQLMKDNPEYAAISCRTQVMIGTGNIFDGHEDEDIVEFPHPGGSLRIMRTHLVRQVGGWRDDVGGRGQEERYICGRLREKGHKTGFAVKVRALHLFGDKETDRWGYPKNWKPEMSGHSDIWHPVLERGDDPDEIKQYIGGEYA